MNRTWSDDEVTILKLKYEKHGTNISELTATHDRQSIKTKARQLGLTSAIVRRWTPEEDAKLCEEFPLYGINSPSFSNRTENAIRIRASKLGLCKPIAANSLAIRSSKDSSVKDAYVKVRQLTDKLGINYKGLRASMTRYNIGFADMVTRLETMYYEDDGVVYRTVESFVLPIDNYFTYDGLLWTAKCFCDKFNPSWSPLQFSAFRSRNECTADVAFRHLQYGELPNDSYRNCDLYTAEEDKIILDNSHLSAEELLGLLPGRTLLSVVTHARSLGVPISKSSAIMSRIRIRRDVRNVCDGYFGTDGKSYYFVRCAICSRVLILDESIGLKFTHDDICCSQHEVPSGMLVPYTLQVKE